MDLPAGIEALVTPRQNDLGDGFIVKRALPSAQRRSVGPFVFFDEMGPHTLQPGEGLDVRPHPHIGLATVTYLFDGEIDHRDSLGTLATIRPGEVNWMTAGRGIVHSERTPAALRSTGSRLWGLQVWVALPVGQEDAEPTFVHHDAPALPSLVLGAHRARVVLGSLFGATSPVSLMSEMVYADVHLAGGDQPLQVPTEPVERGVYVVEGEVRVDATDRSFGAGQLLVLVPGEPVTLHSTAGARLVVFGGAPLDAPRFLWWNFVSSRRERIEQAQEDWRAQRFPPVPGETEFIPLPAATKLATPPSAPSAPAAPAAPPVADYP